MGKRICLILCVVFFIAGIIISVPDYELKHYGNNAVEEYVGGDAYNYIIEASLRGGKIAGTMISKTICFSMSAISFLAFFFLENQKRKENKMSDVKNNGDNINENSNIL